MKNEDKEKFLQRIQKRQGTYNGKPVIGNTRIKVEVVLYALANGYNYEEIIQDYPGICKNDIIACLLYAAEHLE